MLRLRVCVITLCQLWCWGLSYTRARASGRLSKQCATKLHSQAFAVVCPHWKTYLAHLSLFLTTPSLDVCLVSLCVGDQTIHCWASTLPKPSDFAFSFGARIWTQGLAHTKHTLPLSYNPSFTFFFLKTTFEVQKLHFHEVQNVFLVECVFSVIAKNSLPTSRSQIFSVFSSRCFIVFVWFGLIVLRMDPRISHVVGKNPNSKLHPQFFYI